MLYDDVMFCFEKAKTLSPEQAEIAWRLRECKAFSIENEFFEIVDKKFLVDPKFVDNVKHNCKLPYVYSWIEWKFEGRKVGAILIEDDQGTIQVMMCDAQGVKSIFVVHPQTMAMGKERPLLGVQIQHSGLSKDREHGVCAGLGNIVLGIISAINSPTIIETHKVDMSDANYKRGKSAKKLHTYSIIKLKQKILKAIKEDERIDKESGNRKLHWRRGHFKHCRTGTFWWSAHLAGSAENGVVKSSYVAEA